MATLLGIDIGTTSTKTSLFDTDGVLVAAAFRDYDVIVSEPGAAEQDPWTWWVALKSCVQEISSQASHALDSIRAIGVSCTNAIVAIDAQRRPLGNAVMQLDRRPDAGVHEIRRKIEPLSSAVHVNVVRPSIVSAPLMRWVIESTESAGSAVHCILNPSGFINLCLCGELSMDESRASTSGLFDLDACAWCEELATAVGIDPGLLPPVFPSTDIVGRVTKAAAEELNVPAGVPVIAGAMDTVAAAIGLGVYSSDQASLMLGTVGRVVVPADTTASRDRFLNVAYPGAKRFLAMAPVCLANRAIRWISSLFPRTGIDATEAFDPPADRDTTESGRLLFLPYFQGEWSPGWVSTRKATYVGLSVDHGPTHFARAVLEGIAYAFRENLALLKADGLAPGKLVVGGGGAEFPVVRRTVADVCGLPLVWPADVEGETRGAAILAGVGAGVYASCEASPAVGGRSVCHQPDESRRSFYDREYTRFLWAKDAFVVAGG